MMLVSNIWHVIVIKWLLLHIFKFKLVLWRVKFTIYKEGGPEWQLYIVSAIPWSEMSTPEWHLSITRLEAPSRVPLSSVQLFHLINMMTGFCFAFHNSKFALFLTKMKLERYPVTQAPTEHRQKYNIDILYLHFLDMRVKSALHEAD